MNIKKNPILLFINVHHREFIGAIVIIANWRLELIKGESNHITNRFESKNSHGCNHNLGNKRRRKENAAASDLLTQ